MISLSPFIFLNTPDLVENNFLTRSLSGNANTPLREEDLVLAKEILKRKFIIGLFEEMLESMRRFEMFFGWNLNVDAQVCQANEIGRELAGYYNMFAKLSGPDEPKDTHPGLTDEALESIIQKNSIDLMLFDYAKFLFGYQGRVLFGVDAELDDSSR